jgi:hypothetical protein
VRPVKEKLALLWPALTETVAVALPSVMVKVLAVALLKDSVPDRLYWLVADRHSLGVTLVRAKAGMAVQEVGAKVTVTSR